MAKAQIEVRELLAPYLGEWVRCRGVVVRDGADHARPETLVAHLDALLDGAWVRVGSHCWVRESRLARNYGRGVAVEFEAVVRTYKTRDPITARPLVRYAVGRPRGVESKGPADLLELARELVGVWGFDRVADAVVAAGEQG